MTELELLRSEVFENQSLGHAFTTRVGGVSRGPYGSLNLTRSRGDDAGSVAENRERVRGALGFEHLVFASQVHGRGVIRVDGPPKGELPVGESDALITDKPGLGLVCQTADCTPILVLDPVHRAVAAIHSGWRGTVKNIISSTLEAMRLAYGSHPGDLRVAIGPSISPDNYRVGAEVVSEFAASFRDLDGIVSRRDDEGGGHLDVGAACHRQLLDAGVPVAQIDRSLLCTYAESERLFSARRSHHAGETGVFGGQGGIIGLKSRRD
jgi:YfiH family protein